MFASALLACAALWVHVGCGGQSNPGLPPTITASPKDAAVDAGQSATFTVTAEGTGPLRYQWMRNGFLISGATTATLQTPATTLADDNASFRVIVSNGSGDTPSEAATLRVRATASLAIATQPLAQRVTTGSTATFWVAATSASPITCQWKKNGNPIAGATSPRYTTAPTTAGDDGASYSVTLQSGAESLDSQAAVLEIDPQIDDLMALAGGKSWSSSTPMGRHYQGLAAPTDADRAYLADPANQPPVPPGLASTHHLAAFTVTLFPNGQPVPADINQHGIGDCNGLSAMACMVYQAPDFVKGLITPEASGVFAVAMFDPQGRPITVKVDSQFVADSGGRLVAATGKNGKADWATVLEKAIMKYNVVFKADTTIEGIGSENVTPLFTGAGSSFPFDRGRLSAEQITRVVKASLACGKFITGGFGTVAPWNGVNSVTGHGYACYWPVDDGTMISMRNPWGMNPKASGGYDTSLDGMLNLPGTSEWAKTIDLRVIDSGIAGSRGRSAPYAPSPVQSVMESIHLAPELAQSGY